MFRRSTIASPSTVLPSSSSSSRPNLNYVRSGIGSAKSRIRPRNRRTTISASFVSSLFVFLGSIVLPSVVYVRYFMVGTSQSSNGKKGQPQSQLQSQPQHSMATTTDACEYYVSHGHDHVAASAAMESIIEEYYERYGGKVKAEALLQRAVQSYGAGRDVESMAQRILDALANADVDVDANVDVDVDVDVSHDERGPPKPQFVMAFGGYSVTVGRGNYFHQSYPFVVQSILAQLAKDHFYGLDVLVRNAAIGGIPGFPYGWCLGEFLGTDVDVVSWDYAMNEKKTDASGFEAYWRHALSLPKAPMMVLLEDDGPTARGKVMQSYVDRQIVRPDPVRLNRANVADPSFLAIKDDAQRPVGYRDWDTWGAPPGSPGQSPWHPKYKEHELLGWSLAVHFLKGFRRASERMAHDNNNNHHWCRRRETPLQVRLPKPLAADANVPLLSGRPVDSASSDNYDMGLVSCRTSFRPTQRQEADSLLHRVVSGLSPTHYDPDQVMGGDRTEADYADGWIVDVGALEKKTKRKVEQVKGPTTSKEKGGSGMGYIDMKIALYGLPASGPLELWLPYEGNSDDNDGEPKPVPVSHYIRSVVFCEVNEKRGDGECDLSKDLEVTLGGRPPQRSAWVEGDNAVYLKKRICRIVEPADDATMEDEEGNSSTRAPKGVRLRVTVLEDSGVTHAKGACSLSHVVWENVQRFTTSSTTTEVR